MGDRPARMIQGDREPDPLFDPDENLYRRFPGTYLQGAELHTDQLPFYPALSVNRQKYSQPHDVLYPAYFPDFGVFQFKVRDIPPTRTTDSGSRFEWNPAHVPEPENYAHSEVRTHKDGVFSENLKIGPNLLKKWFREYLRDRAAIVIQPGAASPD